MPAIQIRNVPEETTRILKSRAAAAGQSLSEYLLRELDAIAARPTQEEILDRIAAREAIAITPARQVIEEERQARP